MRGSFSFSVGIFLVLFCKFAWSQQRCSQYLADLSASTTISQVVSIDYTGLDIFSLSKTERKDFKNTELSTEVKNIYDGINQLHSYLGLTNLKPEVFKQYKEQMAEKIAELKEIVSQLEDPVLISEFNSLVIDALFAQNKYEKMGFTTETETSFLLNSQTALTFFIERPKDLDHHSSLLKEFSNKVQAEAQSYFSYYESAQTREQFELMFTLIAMNAPKEIFDAVSQAKNKDQALAMQDLISKGLLDPTLISAALSIENQVQQIAFSKALEFRVSNESFYTQEITKIKNEEDLSVVLKKIKAGEF